MCLLTISSNNEEGYSGLKDWANKLLYYSNLPMDEKMYYKDNFLLNVRNWPVFGISLGEIEIYKVVLSGHLSMCKKWIIVLRRSKKTSSLQYFLHVMGCNAKRLQKLLVMCRRFTCNKLLTQFGAKREQVRSKNILFVM